jgi:hypothetical protein
MLLMMTTREWQKRLPRKEKNDFFFSCWKKPTTAVNFFYLTEKK